GAVATHSSLAVIFQIVIVLSTALFSLCAHAADWCVPGYVPTAFNCGFGNLSVSTNTLCYGPSITAIEASIRANNNPSYWDFSTSPPTLIPDTWSSWYLGTWFGY